MTTVLLRCALFLQITSNWGNMEWYTSSLCGTVANICCCVCGQVEPIGMFPLSRLPFLEWGGLGWASNCCFTTHWGHLTQWISCPRAALTLFVCSMSINCAYAYECIGTQINIHSDTQAYPGEHKHHFVGHQETCCFPVECGWPMTTMFTVNILSLPIITSLRPSALKPVAGESGPYSTIYLEAT